MFLLYTGIFPYSTSTRSSQIRQARSSYLSIPLITVSIYLLINGKNSFAKYRKYSIKSCYAMKSLKNGLPAVITDDGRSGYFVVVKIDRLR